MAVKLGNVKRFAWFTLTTASVLGWSVTDKFPWWAFAVVAAVLLWVVATEDRS